LLGVKVLLVVWACDRLLSLRARVGLAGKAVKCPHFGRAVLVPGVEAGDSARLARRETGDRTGPPGA